MKKNIVLIICAAWIGFISCEPATQLRSNLQDNLENNDTPIKPVVVTEKVYDDSDDPAIWINVANKDSSLIIGTDKNKDNGGLFVFGLNGKIDQGRSVRALKRTNNVDVAYGLMLGGGKD